MPSPGGDGCGGGGILMSSPQHACGVCKFSEVLCGVQDVNPIKSKTMLQYPLPSVHKLELLYDL